MGGLIRRWLVRHWQRQGEVFLDRLRGFGRANILTAAGILLVLFAHYCVLDPLRVGGPEDQFANSYSEAQGDARTSPSGQYAVSVGPPLLETAGTEHELRDLTVRARGNESHPSRVLGSLRVTGYLEAHWSPDSRFVAIVTAPGGGNGVMTSVLVIEAEGPVHLSLPTSVDPVALLAAEDSAAELQTGSVRFVGWRGDTLKVVGMGHGWDGPPAAAGSRQVGIQCQFNLGVSGTHIRELSRDC